MCGDVDISSLRIHLYVPLGPRPAGECAWCGETFHLLGFRVMGTFCNVSVTLKQLNVWKMLIQYVQFPLAGRGESVKEGEGMFSP